MIDEVKLVLFFLQTLHYRDDLEEILFKNLKAFKNNVSDKVDHLYGQRVHSELTKNTSLILTKFGVLYNSKDTLNVNEDRLEYFIRLVEVAKASRTYRWPTQRPKPFIYVSPPSLIPSEFSGDVDDISNLLINLIISSEKRISIMSPFTNEEGFRSVLTPLKACKNNPKINLYLTAEKNDELMIYKQVMRQIPSNMFHNVKVYFCSTQLVESDNLPHAKVLIVDSKKGYLGSANFTRQGLKSRFELGVELDEQQSSTIEKLLDILVTKEMFQEYKT